MGWLSARRFLVPEVVQISAMDCGPAALKALLDGYRRGVSYGRLREACQTDVDGTSIDTLEEVALELGLDAQQVVVPSEHVFLPHARLLPAIVVVRLKEGVPHFVVVWRRIGAWLQIMDPAVGRRWVHHEELRSRLLRLPLELAVDDWMSLAESDGFRRGLTTRMRLLGLSRRVCQELIDDAREHDHWRPMAVLDAATRMVAALVSGRGTRRGREATLLLQALVRRELHGEEGIIPATWFGALPARDGDPGTLRVVGAVLVRVSGRTSTVPDAKLRSAELTRAIASPGEGPGHAIWRLFVEDGLFTPALMATVLVLAACTTIGEALVFRSVLDMGRELSAIDRWFFLAATMTLLIGALLLEWSLAQGLLGLGRRLEGRLRVAFQSKVGRLANRYFRSRTIADMAERVHACQAVRGVPTIGGQLLRTVAQLGMTALALSYLDPALSLVVVIATGVVIALPLIMNGLLQERELRVRSQRGALGRFFLDSLLGLAPLRVHGAEGAVRKEHEGLLVEWYRAGLRLQRGQLAVEGVQVTAGFGMAGFMVLDHLMRQGVGGTTLLILYWCLRLPELGKQAADLVAFYPAQRNATLRVVEALGAAEEGGEESTPLTLLRDASKADETPQRTGLRAAGVVAVLSIETVGNDMRPHRVGSSDRLDDERRGVAISLRDLSVRLGGHDVLLDVNLEIAAGEHVAIVGRSGAGKSTLIGLLLGHNRPSRGLLQVDGARLDASRLAALRRVTAWIDPGVALWNRSLLENVKYGSGRRAAPVGPVLDLAGASGLVADLGLHGLRTSIGESGMRLSGGEGQRVRFARGLYREGTRLALLDEAFRGLSRDERSKRLDVARRHFAGITLLSVMHDLELAATFDRVVVIEEGRLVESGTPAELDRAGTRFHHLRSSEVRMLREGFDASKWRRLHVREGRLVEGVAEAEDGA